MTNPNVQLKEYLDKLIHRFLNIKSMSQQRKAILAWQTPTRIETLNRGYYFFGLATYSLSRIVFTELSMLLSPREKRSLLDWLKKARDHAPKLKPTRYNPIRREHELIEVEQYRSLIDGQMADLDVREDIIKRMKARRGKVKKHKGTFQVKYCCRDDTDKKPTITAATLNGIPVRNRQVVKLKLSDRTKVKSKHRSLELEAPSFTLEVSCEDASGKRATATASPVFTGKHGKKNK